VATISACSLAIASSTPFSRGSRRFPSACRSCSQISRTLESRALASTSTSGRITPSFSDAKPPGSDSPQGGFESGRVSTFQQRVFTIQSLGHRLPKSPVRGRRTGPLRPIISTETPLVSCEPPPQMARSTGWDSEASTRAGGRGAAAPPPALCSLEKAGACPSAQRRESCAAMALAHCPGF
jgi:hypothetical protein